MKERETNELYHTKVRMVECRMEREISKSFLPGDQDKAKTKRD